jgi:hypothetical protein
MSLKLVKWIVFVWSLSMGIGCPLSVGEIVDSGKKQGDFEMSSSPEVFGGQGHAVANQPDHVGCRAD